MNSRTIFEQTLLGFLGPVRPHLDDPEVSEVMINGPSEIYIERAGRLELSECRFESHEALMSALRSIAQYVGRPLDEEHPVLEGHLPDGSRVEAVLPPAAPDGPAVAVRRFRKDALTIDKLIDVGSLTHEAAACLGELVRARQNFVIAGGTGSGKTSVLNALSGLIPADQRLVVIEDAREIRLQQPHVVSLEAQPGDQHGRGRIDVRALLKATLRMRPDRIVVGEIRSGEALDLVQAMTSGHGGCLTTVHATHPIDVLHRLETMALMNDVELPLSALRDQLASAVNVIVQTARLSDGSRAITQITEVCGRDEGGSYTLEDLFRRGPEYCGPHELVATGYRPSCLGARPAHAPLQETGAQP